MRASNTILIGDVRAKLGELPDGCVHCVVRIVESKGVMQLDADEFDDAAVGPLFGSE